MPLKYIYKMNGNFLNKKDIEKFADETNGYCEEKWGDSYLEKSFDGSSSGSSRDRNLSQQRCWSEQQKNAAVQASTRSVFVW